MRMRRDVNSTCLQPVHTNTPRLPSARARTTIVLNLPGAALDAAARELHYSGDALEARPHAVP